MQNKKRKFLGVISVVLALITLYSMVMTVFAWTDFSQSKTNDFKGTVEKTNVVLQKYEKDKDGNIITRPVSGAEFRLYRITDGGETPLGTYTTDQNGKIIVEKLSTGSYKFVEISPGYGYVLDKNNDGKDITEYPFEIKAEYAEGIATVNVTAYNRRMESGLEISKTVKNGNGSALTNDQKNTSFEFHVTFSDGGNYKYKINGAGELKSLVEGKLTLKHGETAVFENIPVGVYYTVSETPMSGYTTQSENNMGNIEKDKVSSAKFTNIYTGGDYGSLEFSKAVSGTGADKNKEFEFKVTFSPAGDYTYKIDGKGAEIPFTSGGIIKLKHGQSAVFDKLPVGVSYTVTELSANKDGYTASAENVSGKIIPEGVVCAFENHKDSGDKPGSLAVKKTVTGEGADKNKKFKFTVTFTGADAVNKAFEYKINGAVAGSITNSGTIELAHDETAVFENIPAGVQWKVVEENPTADGYTPSATEQNGAIPENCRAYAYFNNHKEPERPDGKITVEKIVKGEIPESEKDREFWFTFKKNDEPPVRFSLKAGEKKTFIVKDGDSYSVTEDDPFGFGYIQTSAVNGTGTAGTKEIKVTITNSYIGKLFVEISGEKSWDMQGADGSNKPDSIIVHLKNGDKIVETKTVKPDANGNWKYSFTAPKYDSEGKEIKYTIHEEPVLGFETSYDGFNIKNKYTGKTDISVKKVWNDGENPSRPTEIKVQLYKNGVPEGEPVALNKDNHWSHTWSDLDSSAKWTVDEIEVPEGYSKSVSNSSDKDFVITNSMETPTDDTVLIRGVKSWKHGSNPVSSRPTSIHIAIKDGDKIVVEADITDNVHWQWSFTLPKFHEDGSEIKYSIHETPVLGYETTVDGFNLVNRHTSYTDENITIGGTKTWVFGNAPLDDRPSSITVIIKNGSTIVKELRVTEAGGWKWSVDLPKFDKNGKEIKYTVTESNVPHYTHTVNGYDIVNTYKGPKYPGDGPSTGDSSKPLLWAMIALVSGGILVFTLSYGKLMKKNQYKGKYYKA